MHPQAALRCGTVYHIGGYLTPGTGMRGSVAYQNNELGFRLPLKADSRLVQGLVDRFGNIFAAAGPDRVETPLELNKIRGKGNETGEVLIRVIPEQHHADSEFRKGREPLAQHGNKLVPDGGNIILHAVRCIKTEYDIELLPPFLIQETPDDAGQIACAKGIDRIPAAVPGNCGEGINRVLHIIPLWGALQGPLSYPQNEGIIPEPAPVIAVEPGKAANVKVRAVHHIDFSVARVRVAVMQDVGDVDMKRLPQFGVVLGAGGDEGIDAALLGEGLAVQQADFVAIHRVPVRGAVGVVGLLERTVPGGFNEQHRGDVRLLSDKEVKPPVNPLFYPQIFLHNGQVLPPKRRYAEEHP